MSRLLKKIVVFALLILVMISPFALGNKMIFERKLKSNIFRLADNVDTLIVGDSHSETSLDPQLIPNSINLSNSGESIFFTYYKLKHLITQNPGKARKVILAFSYHNISKKFQDDYLFDDVKSAYSLENYYKYMDYSGKVRLINLNNLGNLVVYGLKYELGVPLMEYNELRSLKSVVNGTVKSSDVEGFGGFRASDNTDLDLRKIDKKIKHYYLDNDLNYAGYSEIMCESLNRIASLCVAHHIKLFLYNAPLNHAYRRRVPVAAYGSYDKVIKSLKNRYPDVTIVDLSGEPLDDSYFQDGDHVNKRGANVASCKLAGQLVKSPARN